MRVYTETLNGEWKLDYNVWCENSGSIIGDVEVERAYRILLRDGPKYNFKLVRKKRSVWWPMMDCADLRERFNCRLEVDDHDRPLSGILLVCSPVGSDEFVTYLLTQKVEKVDKVLELVKRLKSAQVAMQIHKTCLSVVLFTYIFHTTPPAHKETSDSFLDEQQALWHDKLITTVPILTGKAIQQERIPLRCQGLVLTAPSDAVIPSYLGSRCGIASHIA